MRRFGPDIFRYQIGNAPVGVAVQEVFQARTSFTGDVLQQWWADKAKFLVKSFQITDLQPLNFTHFTNLAPQALFRTQSL